MDKIYVNGKWFNTEVAISEAEQAKGLMFKEWPPPVMVFPYKDATIRKFWMKNTVSPLDIVFCREGKVVEILKGEPFSTKLIGPDCLVDMVVELPAGTSEKLEITKGDDVVFKPTLQTISKLLLS